MKLQELNNHMYANVYRDFLEHHLLRDVLENVPLNIRQQMFFQQDSGDTIFCKETFGTNVGLLLAKNNDDYVVISKESTVLFINSTSH